MVDIISGNTYIFLYNVKIKTTKKKSLPMFKPGVQDNYIYQSDIVSILVIH